MSKASIVAQSPILMASDLQRSMTYWSDKAGFEVVGEYGEPVDFAILRRDGAYMMLTQAPADHVIVPHWKVKEKMNNVYFWVDDATALYEEMKERGATLDYGPVEQPYGCLEFGIQDPDGYDIAFGQDLTSQPKQD